MRILDKARDQSVKNITLLLTVSEASELRDKLNGLLFSNLRGDHIHVDDKEYQHEITVALYDSSTMAGFAERIKRLILEDK